MCDDADFTSNSSADVSAILHRPLEAGGWFLSATLPKSAPALLWCKPVLPRRAVPTSSIGTSTLIPNSRLRFRRHHHGHLLLCHCPRPPLRLLPRLALGAGRGHWHLPSAQENLRRSILGRSILSQSILAVVCSCPMVRLTRFLRVAPRACLGEKCKASRLPILVRWICCFVRDGVLPKIKTLLIPAASASSLPRAFLRVSSRLSGTTWAAPHCDKPT